MNGPFHDFLLLDLDQYNYTDYIKLIHHPSSIRLGDDLICYMNDSLKWIPSYNPARKEPHIGLCLYGPTVIKTEGAKIAEEIFRSWISLFKNAPDTITLTGSFSWIEGEETPETGDYEILEFSKQELIDALTKIADFCRIVKNSKGKKHLLHLGI